MSQCGHQNNIHEDRYRKPNVTFAPFFLSLSLSTPLPLSLFWLLLPLSTTTLTVRYADPMLITLNSIYRSFALSERKETEDYFNNKTPFIMEAGKERLHFAEWVLEVIHLERLWYSINFIRLSVIRLTFRRLAKVFKHLFEKICAMIFEWQKSKAWLECGFLCVPFKDKHLSWMSSKSSFQFSTTLAGILNAPLRATWETFELNAPHIDWAPSTQWTLAAALSASKLGCFQQMISMNRQGSELAGVLREMNVSQWVWFTLIQSS